jgi:guanyl-specific ribonuclease Sa
LSGSKGYKGGKKYENDGRYNSYILPAKTKNGKAITYREWDVNPKGGGNRGQERLVTGSDGSFWFTNEHYRSFVKMN